MSKKKIIVRESTGQRIIEQSRIRLLCVGLFFLLCFASICFRMIEVAVIKNRNALTITVSDPESEKGEEVTLASDAPLRRADIIDRNGTLLATSLMTASLYAHPREVRGAKEIAAKLAKILKVDAKKLEASLTSEKSFVWLKRNLTPREQQAVNSLGIPGLYFEAEEKRVYPYGAAFAHALGFVGIDNKGMAGLERGLEARLRDPNRPEPVALSLDLRLQAILRDEMKKSIHAYKAIGGAGVIMDVRTGEILSLVSLPDFDPNNPGSARPERLFNRTTLGVYEMGSTFKTFTMALGLGSGKVGMKGGYDATSPFKVSSFTIQDSHPERRWLSVPEIYAYSSNIGTAKMALDVGTRAQKEFLGKLGMFEPVEIEIPERGTPLYPSKWKEINTVTVSYGHGISVTPLHLVRGIAALVNGGELPRLTMLKDGNKHAEPGVQVVDEDTSKNIRRLMRLVVGHGTGAKADVPGYRVGGKTGTAEKVVSGGKYAADAKLASFIGTFPVDDPRYIVLVMIDEPKGDDSTYGFATGGWISAPVAGQVIARMGPLLGIKPAYDVPGDDAEKFWAGRKTPKTTAQPVAAKKYLHAASY